MHASKDHARAEARDLGAEVAAELGSRVAQLRAEQKLTLGQLAARADVSSSVISELERGRANPSIMTVGKLARALGVSFATFFTGVDEPDTPYGIVRHEERRGLEIGPAEHSYEQLTPTSHGKLASYITRIPPNSPHSASSVTLQHEGEEFILVLEGELVLQVGGEIHRLRAGDAATFDASLPHAPSNDGDVPVIFLTCMTPSF